MREMHQQNRRAWNEGAVRYAEQVDLPAEIARRVPQTFSLLMRKE